MSHGQRGQIFRLLHLKGVGSSPTPKITFRYTITNGLPTEFISDQINNFWTANYTTNWSTNFSAAFDWVILKPNTPASSYTVVSYNPNGGFKWIGNLTTNIVTVCPVSPLYIGQPAVPSTNYPNYFQTEAGACWSTVIGQYSGYAITNNPCAGCTPVYQPIDEPGGSNYISDWSSFNSYYVPAYPFGVLTADGNNNVDWNNFPLASIAWVLGQDFVTQQQLDTNTILSTTWYNFTNGATVLTLDSYLLASNDNAAWYNFTNGATVLTLDSYLLASNYNAAWGNFNTNTLGLYKTIASAATLLPTNNGTAWNLTVLSGTIPYSLITSPPWLTTVPVTATNTFLTTNGNGQFLTALNPGNIGSGSLSATVTNTGPISITQLNTNLMANSANGNILMVSNGALVQVPMPTVPSIIITNSPRASLIYSTANDGYNANNTWETITNWTQAITQSGIGVDKILGHITNSTAGDYLVSATMNYGLVGTYTANCQMRILTNGVAVYAVVSDSIPSAGGFGGNILLAMSPVAVNLPANCVVSVQIETGASGTSPQVLIYYGSLSVF